MSKKRVIGARQHTKAGMILARKFLRHSVNGGDGSVRLWVAVLVDAILCAANGCKDSRDFIYKEERHKVICREIGLSDSYYRKWAFRASAMLAEG